MANPYAAARTNYVKFDDFEALKSALSPFPLEVVEKNSKHALLVRDYEGWPGFGIDEEDVEHEFSFEEHVCPHLAEGEVLVAMEAGHEKLRYVWGRATAYIKSGDAVSVSLDDIYDLAKAKFGIESITEASY